MLSNNQKGIGGIAIKMLTELSKNNCLAKDLVCPECGRKSVDYIYLFGVGVVIMEYRLVGSKFHRELRR